jgi:uncharacterized protein (TIGR02099 family)
VALLANNTIIRKLASHLWLLLMLLIIIAGIIVSAGRLASPYLKEFKNDIQEEASRIIGTRVSIATIDASWKGLGPKLVLRNIKISNTNIHTPPLVLRQVDLDLSLKTIFNKGEVLPWNITLHGLRLQLIQDTDGDLKVIGLSDNEQKEKNTFSIDPLLKMRRIQLADTYLQWTDRTGKTPSTEFDHINLLIRNNDNHHQLDLSFSVPGSQSQNIRVAADFKAEIDKLEHFSGEFYIKTNNFQAAEWVKSLLPPSLKIDQAKMNSELWLTADNGKFTMAQGNIGLSNIMLSSGDDKQFTINQTSGVLHWHGNETGHYFVLQDFLLDTPGYETSKLSLRYAREKDKPTYLAISELDLDIWPHFIDFMHQALPEKLVQMNIAGQVKQFQASWTSAFSDWSASGKLENFTIIPSDNLPSGETLLEGIPGITNFSADFIASAKGGKISIDSNNSTYIQPSLFRKAIPLHSLRGDVHWTKSNDKDIHIFTDHLTAVFPHLTTATRLSVELSAAGETYLDVQTDFRDGDGSGTELYLPYSIMDDSLVSWLDRAIISGTVTSGTFVFKGPVNDFAFSKTHNGHFEVLFNVENLILDYLEEWPRLEEVDAQVRFHNNSLDIELVNARYLDSEISEASAHIESLHPLSPLEITGLGTGPVKDSMHLLTETPLKEQFASLANALTFTGNNKIHLDFDIPLGHVGEYTLDGSATFQNNALQLTDWNLKLDNINGKLKFDLDGLKSDNLSASLLGSKINVKISHDQKRNTSINSSVKLNTSQLSRIFSDFPTDFISGEADWNVRLTVPPLTHKKSVATLGIESSLEGLQIDAPDPFGKRVNSITPLSIKASLTPGHEMPVSFTYNDIATAKLMLYTPRDAPLSLKSGIMHFGPTPAPQIKDNLFQLTGTIDTLALDSWLAWQPVMNSRGQNPLPIKIDLGSHQLNYRELSLSEFSLQAEKSANRLFGQINSQELSGKFEIPSFNPLGLLIIDLEKAALKIQANTASASSAEKKSVTNPADVPAMDLKIRNFTINDYEFGQVLVQTSKQQQNIKLDRFLINGELLNFDGNGLWSVVNKQQRSLISFNMESSEFGTVLKNLGFTPQIDKGEASCKGHISWQGSPHHFNTETLSGELDVSINKGRFLDFEPGMGRILGILNVAALYRRLTLDFSDLFKEGFSFDKIDGHFLLDAGNAWTDNLVINSPAATIELNGRTGLAAQDYEQQVTVTPSLQSTITIAGAVAGGPAGAAIAYLAQKLVGKQVDKIARTRYSITGSWDDPNIINLEIPEKINVEEPEDLGILEFE